LAINPDTGIPIHTLVTFESYLAHDLTVLTREARSSEQDANLSEKDSRREKPQAVVHFAPYFWAGLHHNSERGKVVGKLFEPQEQLSFAKRKNAGVLVSGQ